MKKILLAFSLALLSTTAFAGITLKGSITNEFTQDGIKGINITVSGRKGEDTSRSKGKYSAENIPSSTASTTANKVAVTFTDGANPAKFYTKTVELFINEDAGVYQAKTQEKPVSITSKKNGDDTELTLNISLKPKPDVVITGFVSGEDGMKLKGVTVSGSVSTVGKDSVTTAIDAENITPSGEDGKFIIRGYKNEKAATEYDLIFSSNLYKDKNKKVKLDANGTKNDVKITMTEKKGSHLREDTLTGMTGFGCSELMPKYLVGASCVENREIEGDATDIALWIQKFGNKITSIITMLAVVLIVWNAFNIVTAAGDSEKIAQGKKGILWTVLGLVLTMFAYVIVKTVIVLTYTQ